MRDWEILLFVVSLIATLWVVIGYGASLLGPWKRLLAHYPVTQWMPTVSRAHLVSLDCGWMSYGNCLTLDFAEESFTVRMAWACLPFHPPFTVPKSAIRGVRRGRLLFIYWITFWVDDCRFLLWGPNARTRFFDGIEG